MDYYMVIRQGTQGAVKFETFTTLNAAIESVQKYGGYIVELLQLTEERNGNI